MALGKLHFTKNWNSKADFPTFEANEAQVRADIQLLYDEIQAAFNQLIDDLNAQEVPFTPSEDVPEDNVQDAIENVQQQVAGLVLDELVIPNGSISQEKLSTVDSESGAAVGPDQIALRAVTSEKIGFGEVKKPNLGLKAVDTLNIEDGAVTLPKLAPSALIGKADLDGGILLRQQFRLRVQNSSLNGSRLLQASDAGSLIQVYDNGQATFVVPKDSTILPGSFVVILNRRDTGGTIITPSSSPEVLLHRYGTDSSAAARTSLELEAGQTVILFKIHDTRWVAACFQ